MRLSNAFKRWRVHGILLETCSDESAFAAAAWILMQFPELPVLVSFRVRARRRRQALALARLAAESDIVALGVNWAATNRLRMSGGRFGCFARNDQAAVARPNAGTPRREGMHGSIRSRPRNGPRRRPSCARSDWRCGRLLRDDAGHIRCAERHSTGDRARR